MHRRSAGPTTGCPRDSPPVISLSGSRRAASASKLGSIFNPSQCNNAVLADALNDLAITTKLTLKAAEAQRRGAAKLAEWARDSRNAAIDDVMGQTNEIFRLHGEKLSQFARDYDHFVQQLSKMSDAERAVKEAERRLHALEDKEKRINKELRKGSGLFRSRRSVGDTDQLREQLEAVCSERELAARALSDTRAEMEVVKMFRFRHGMQGIADAYVQYSTMAAAIFGCHREITELVPAISTQDVRRMVYDGNVITRDRVDDLRRSLDSTRPSLPPSSLSTSQLLGSHRRRSEPQRQRGIRDCSGISMGTPPPPYTPTAPEETPRRQTQSASHLQPIRDTPLQPLPSLTTPQRPSHLQPITDNHAHQAPPTRRAAHLQEIPREDRQRVRRSAPSAPCCPQDRLYPILPPNPYRDETSD